MYRYAEAKKARIEAACEAEVARIEAAWAVEVARFDEEKVRLEKAWEEKRAELDAACEAEAARVEAAEGEEVRVEREYEEEQARLEAAEELRLKESREELEENEEKDDDDDDADADADNDTAADDTAAAAAAAADDDDDDASPLLGPFLRRLPDVFNEEVLKRLNPTDLALLSRAGPECRAATVASDLPRAGTAFSSRWGCTSDRGGAVQASGWSLGAEPTEVGLYKLNPVYP